MSKLWIIIVAIIAIILISGGIYLIMDSRMPASFGIVGILPATFKYKYYYIENSEYWLKEDERSAKMITKQEYKKAWKDSYIPK